MPASIPSPSGGVLEIGPLSIHAYGLMIALGVVAAVWLTGRRLEARGGGTRDDASSMAVWAVLAGIAGARLYHVITDWSDFEDDPLRIVQIWKGGLGIPGGLLAGIVVGWYVTKRRGVDPRVMATCAAPAIALAQSIGRWGNWFNQELFGRATDLPWALEISDDKLPAGFAPGTTFHPTFLYESLWNLALCGVLILIDRRRSPRPPRLMGMYVLGYGVGRFWVEGLRIDDADEFGPLRFNQWVALTVAVLAAVYLVVSARGDAATPEAEDGAEDTAEDTADGGTEDEGRPDDGMSGSGDPADDDYVAADERDPDLRS
ncbi:MAG: prolipoprotein diacylglyceryl transferase [Acidimicrobiales bacterium]|nr:prolipoprotein diacylglyceryl transferase [Acidimicrobiales bacterium]